MVSQYQKMLFFDGCKLTFDEGALRLIAKTALSLKTGARGLRNIMETVMMDYMYDVPAKNIKSVRITEKDVAKKLETKCKYRDVI